MKQFTFLLLLLLVFQFSCKKEVGDAIPADCQYEYEPNLADIVGAWEPKQIINLLNGDTVNFELGEGRPGHVFHIYYADSFELRPDSAFATYYVHNGRSCALTKRGNWNFNNDTLFLSTTSSLRKVSILDLNATELVMLDTILGAPSKATYRKNNE